MKYFVYLLMTLFFSGAMAQVGLQGGYTTIKGFGTTGLYHGIHLGLEIPRDDQMSFMGRLSVSLPNTFTDSAFYEARDVMTSPAVITGPIDVRQSLFSVMGGNRYYLGSGYDFGWSVYGGSQIVLQYTSVAVRFDEQVDESKYVVKDANGADLPNKGGIFSLNLGLNAGVKNHFTFGMLYFDIGLSYAILAVPNNTLPINYSFYPPLQFSANLGFRKDLY